MATSHLCCSTVDVAEVHGEFVALQQGRFDFMNEGVRVEHQPREPEDMIDGEFTAPPAVGNGEDGDGKELPRPAMAAAV